MHRTRQQLHRSGRSNMYSESKYTHWARFDPYQGERVCIPRDLLPTLSFQTSDGESCSIYERPLHEAFMRPFGAADVVKIIEGVPRHFLAGLRGIYLMGGTSKQDKIALGDLYRFGQYSWGEICLFAFPRRRLRCWWKQLPTPHVEQEYRRAGANFQQTTNGWECRFNEASLKALYLQDVLIHEIGHHVDRHNFRPFQRGKSRAQQERYAHWFVREYGFQRK